MYDEYYILNLVAEISAVNKSFENKRDSKKGSDIPEYSEQYVMAVQFQEAIEYHSEYGEFPEKLFMKRSPNQTQEELNYIKDNYKQVTLPVFQDFISTISRAFNDNNWVISYDSTNDEKFVGETFKEYVDNLPIYGSLENWLKNILPTLKLKDANGFIVVKPYNLDLIEEEDGSGFIINPDAMIEPTPYYYESESVVAQKQNEYVLLELEEKSVVDYQGTKKRKGYVYEFIDKQNIYRIVQVGKFIDYRFEISISYPHNLGYLPAIVLGGIPRIYDGEIIYQSPFLFAVDLLDLVLMNYAYLQASINKCVYPYRVMLGDPCEFESNGMICDHGWIQNLEGNRSRCPSCNGSGLLSRISPLGELLLRPKTRENDGDIDFTEPLKYVSPDTGVLEYLDKKITQDETRARQILHMKTSESQVRGSDNITATGAAIDQKAQYAFIQGISDQMFNIYEFVLNAIGDMRYGENFLPPTVTYPKSFDLQNEGDLMLQIAEAIKAGLPGFVIHAIIYKFIQSLFYTDKKTTDLYELIVETDRLLILSNDDIALKLARGTASKWEDVLHTSAIQLISSLEDANPKFFEQDIITQKEQLIQAAKDLTDSINQNAPLITI